MHTKSTTASATPCTYSSEWYTCDFISIKDSCPWCLPILKRCLYEQTDRKSIKDDYLVKNLPTHKNTRVLFVFFISSESSQYMRVFLYDCQTIEGDEELDNRQLSKKMAKEIEATQSNLKSFAKAPIEDEVPALTDPVEETDSTSEPLDKTKATSTLTAQLPSTSHLNPTGVLTCSIPLPPSKPVARSLFDEMEEAEKKDPAKEKETNRKIFIMGLETIKSRLEGILKAQREGINLSGMREASPQAMASKLFADLNRLQRSLPQAQLDQDPTIVGLIAAINEMKPLIIFRH